MKSLCESGPGPGRKGVGAGRAGRRWLALVLALAMTAAAAGCTPGAPGAGRGGEPPWGPAARERPMREGLINLTHLNFLVEPMEVDGWEEMALVHIYSEAPNYEWVDAAGEGIACVDDAARAAIVYLEYFRATGDRLALRQARRLLNFVRYMQAEDGEYYNFVTDRQGTVNRTGATSYKSWSWWAARGQWALAEGYRVFREVDPKYAEVLQAAYKKGEAALARQLHTYGRWDELHGVRVPGWLLGGGSDLTSLALLGLAAYYEADPNPETRRLMEMLGEAVAAYQLGSFKDYPFGAQPSNAGSTALWHAWGSHQVAALARAGRVLGRRDWVEAARFTADSLFTFFLVTDLVNEMAVSIRRQGQIAYGASMVAGGFYELYRATGEEKYAKYAGLAGSWFFGNNIAGVAMYDPETGRCFDGIGGANPFLVNRNAGAESTIEALLALIPLTRDPVAAPYLFYKEESRSPAPLVEAESGNPVAGKPVYGRREWTGEANFSSGRYYALAPGDAVAVPVTVTEAGEYHLYLSHLRQAAPAPEAAREIPAVRREGEVAVDGRLDEPAWTRAPRLEVNRPDQLLRGGATWLGPEKESFAFRVLWDDQYLYIGAEVRDPEHRQENFGPSVWRGDALWIYLDTRGDKSRVDVKLTLAQTPQGPEVWDWRGGAFLPGASLAFAETQGGYVYEAALPLAALGGLRPEPGRRVGMEIGRGTTGGGFQDWTGLDPDAAENLAPLVFHAEPPAARAAGERGGQGPMDVAVTIEVLAPDGTPVAEPITVAEAVSPDRDYLWLDRVTGLPLRLEPGTYTLRLTGAGLDPQRASVVDAVWLVPARQRKVLVGPDGRRLELIRHWDAARTEWRES